MKPLCFILFLSLTTLAPAAEELKVVCAGRAEKAPVIDGVLDDACWQQTEVRDDFTTIGNMVPVPQKTTMRWVYDDQALYLGIQFRWDNRELLEKGVGEILARHGADQQQPCQWKDFTNLYGAELFIDKGATRKNFYQLLFNPAGQFCGHFNNIWNQYTGKGQILKSTIQDGCWTAEFVYPAPGVKAGEKWGLNLARNSDSGPYAIWKQTGGAFNAPEMFGTMVIGSYAQWWEAVWGQGIIMELESIGKEVPRYAKSDVALRALYETVREEAERMTGIARNGALTERADFEKMYQTYDAFRMKFDRRKSLYEVHRMIK